MSRQPENTKLKGSIRTNWKKWKGLSARVKKMLKAKTKKAVSNLKNWKAPARNSVHQRQQATSSVQTADPRIGAADGAPAEGVPCAEGRSVISRHVRCRRSATCLRKAR